MVNARGGPSFDGDDGMQNKLSRYRADADGEMKLLWRVGRATLHAGSPAKGEIKSSFTASPVLNGMIAVVDNSMTGVQAFTAKSQAALAMGGGPDRSSMPEHMSTATAELIGLQIEPSHFGTNFNLAWASVNVSADGNATPTNEPDPTLS